MKMPTITVVFFFFSLFRCKTIYRFFMFSLLLLMKCDRVIICERENAFTYQLTRINIKFLAKILRNFSARFLFDRERARHRPIYRELTKSMMNRT